jgi:hypothetical protein
MRSMCACSANAVSPISTTAGDVANLAGQPLVLRPQPPAARSLAFLNRFIQMRSSEMSPLTDADPLALRGCRSGRVLRRGECIDPTGQRDGQALEAVMRYAQRLEALIGCHRGTAPEAVRDVVRSSAGQWGCRHDSMRSASAAGTYDDPAGDSSESAVVYEIREGRPR